MAKHDRSKPVSQASLSTTELEQARKMLAVIEKSQTPFGESAGILAKLKLKIEANEPLSQEEHRQLQRLVNLSRDWDKGVENSAQTEPEETLAG
jgi:predicted outer membrane protein